MEYVRAMGRLFRKANARGEALEAIVRALTDEAKRVLVDRDSGFQRAVETTRLHLHDPQVAERGLLSGALGLYEAFHHARARAPGGMEEEERNRNTNSS